MKKFLAVVLSLALVVSVAACGKKETTSTSEETSTEVSTEVSTEASTEVSEEVVEETPAEDEVTVMSYADYAAAAVDDAVVVEFAVQATQSWWDNKITVYGADADGAYFVYNMTCSEEDAAKLVPGTVIRVTGFKTEWSGEVEIAEGATFEFVDGAEAFTAPVFDATDLLGTDDLVNHINQKVSFKDMTVTAVSYKNDTPGDDIYVNLSKDDTEYYFCLEYYINGSDEEFYNLVGNLEVGSVVDVECFLYWYEGPNGHLTNVVVK